MNPLPQKPIIRAHLINFFKQFRPGDVLKSEDIIKYIKRNTGKTFYSDSILRYARELREEGKVSYTCTHKMARTILITAPGTPHSL